MSFEPNDTIFDAVYTGLSSYYPGSFVTDGEIGDNPSLFFGEDDVDFFQVELDAGDRLTADIDAEVFGSSLDSVLRLFDSFGNEVAVNHEDFGLDSFLDFTASTYDTYYVGVSSFSNFDYDPFVEGSGFGNSTGEYTLNLNLEDNSSSLEPNDTIFDAVYTGLSSYYPGSFVTDGEIGDNPNLFFGENDVDFFQVELDAGDRLTADIDAEVFGSSLDSVLRLFDSFGNEVAVNDDDFGLDSFLDFTASTYDTYYVGVSSYSNFDYDPYIEDSGFGSSTGEYTLNLNLEDNSSSLEPNDTIFDAVYTGLSSYYPGSFVTDGEIGDNPNLLFGEDDVDFFQVELDAGDRLTADIDAEVFGSSLDSVLRLFDSFGNEVAVNDDDFGLDSFLDFTASVFDTYYLGVSSYTNFDYDPFVADSGFGNSTGEYTLDISLSNPCYYEICDV